MQDLVGNCFFSPEHIYPRTDRKVEGLDMLRALGVELKVDPIWPSTLVRLNGPRPAMYSHMSRGTHLERSSPAAIETKLLIELNP